MSGSRESRVRPWHLAGLLTLAIAVLQVAWIFSVRPYGQMDEIAHAYRATSVMAGHLTDHTPTGKISGDLIRVPASIVTAAHNRCAQLHYMKPENCSATSTPDADGNVLVASTAARYNPGYYWAVGWASSLAHGSGVMAVELMRLATALWCDTLFFLAVWITIAFARSASAVLGVLVATMPVLICASVSVAPNGIQMMAGLGLWSALCPLITRDDLARRTKRRLVLVAGLMAALVVLTHTTGPVWVLLSGLALVAALGRRRLAGLWHETRGAFVAASVVVVASGVAMTAWTWLERANAVSESTKRYGSPTTADFFSQPLAWLLQVVGAAPFRNELAPIWVYAVAIAEFALLMSLGFAATTRRIRLVLAGIAGAALAVSFALNFSAYDYLGNAWQGRYVLALAYGLPLLGAAVLDGPVARKAAALVPAVAIATAVVNAATLLNVRLAIEGPKWMAADGIAPAPVTLDVALVTAAGFVLVFGAILTRRYLVAATHLSSAAAASPSSTAAAARSIPATRRSSSEPAPAS